jgi:hypothetical protein
MRAVTATLAAAIEAAERTVDVQAAIDWDADGYNTIDFSDPFTRTGSPGLNPHPLPSLTYSHSGIGGTPSSADFATTGAAATISVPTVSGYRIGYISATLLNVEDSSVAVEWSSPAPTGGNLEPPTPVLRLQNVTNYLMTRVILTPGGGVQVAIIRLLANNELVLVAPTVIPGLTFNPAVTWWTLGQIVGQRIRIKVWPSTSSEPEAWQAVAYDSTWVSGSFGIRAGIGAANTNTKPVVFTAHGYTVSASPLDDISGKLADLTITRDMRGQLPDEVLVVEGISAATGSGALTAADTEDGLLDTVRYFSKTNPNSPLYGKPRDSRPFRASARFLTDAGFETAPRITDGVLRALPVSVGSRSADIDIIDGRDRFRLPITLPAVIADGPWDGTATIPTKPGLEASWVVSYILGRCGYPLSPRPRAECRLHIPMHGSMTPFVQTPFAGAPRAKFEAGTVSDPQRVRFTTGPFFLAADPLAAGTAGYVQMKAPVNATPAEMWNTAGRATGIRVEMWVKRTGVEPTSDAVTVEVYNDVLPTQSRVKFFARTDGFLAVQVINGANSYFQFGPTYTAGAWHLVGVHVDDVTGNIDFRVDGTTSSYAHAVTTAGTLVTASNVACDVRSYAQVAELHVSACTAVVAWLPINHTSGAVVDRLQNRTLGGINPDKPVEAWTLLQQVAAAELGTVRIDYDGRPTVWSAARRNSPDSLTVQRTITARQHLSDLAYDDSRDMIRNLIRVPWTSLVTSGFAPVWSLTELAAVEPGVVKTFMVKTADPLAGSIVTLNGTTQRNADGTGGGYGYTDIVESGIRANLTLTSPTTATLTLENITSTTLWLVDTGGVPDLIMYGTVIKKADTDPVQVQDDAAIARRGGPGVGEAPLECDDNPWVQSMQMALGIGYGLLATLRDEQIVFTDITIPGDPRLEDLDRVRIQDPDGLVLDTPVLVEGVGDVFGPGRYDTSLIARPARDQWILGGPGVGTPLGSTMLGGTP